MSDEDNVNISDVPLSPSSYGEIKIIIDNLPGPEERKIFLELLTAINTALTVSSIISLSRNVDNAADFSKLLDGVKREENTFKERIKGEFLKHQENKYER